ncbi:MAG TPA: hypothetical protein VHH36_08170 [Candidatus Thermoplasmatota archaeon]|nr:hypothetical protein [Candidatus Thermoplasmatota archaeon]
MRLLGLISLLTGEDPALDEVTLARQELEEALETLRRARGAWTGPEGIDVAAVRRALDHAERQLDRARARLERAQRRARGEED